MHHGVTFNFGSTKVCSPAIFETCFSYDNDLWFAATDNFYPTALKGCRGIVFTHGVRVGGRWKKVCPDCISETVRCRKVILGRDIG